MIEMLLLQIWAVLNINMNSVSIIGCGWLGFPLARFLVEKGFSVKGSTTSEEKLQKLLEAGIRPFLITAGPVLLGSKLSDFFDSDNLIINIPPQRRRDNVEELHFIEVKNIIDTAIENGVQNILFCSSTSVYPNNNGIADEQTISAPMTGSAKALVRIENYLSNKSDLNSTILRLSGLVGGERKAGRFLAGKKNLPNGAAPVNLVHRDDCIQAIYSIIKKEAWNELFNVCADEHPFRKDFYKKQAIKLGLEPPVFIENDEPVFKIVSNKKIKEKLGVEFTFPA